MVKDESVAPAAGPRLGISHRRLHPRDFFLRFEEHTRSCLSHALRWQASRIFEPSGSLVGLPGEAIEYLLCALCSQRYGEFPSCSTRRPSQPMSIGTCGMAESSGSATILT